MVVKTELSRYKQIQALLDAEDPAKMPVVRESNSEIAWRLWDEAVQSFDGSIRSIGGEVRGRPVDYSQFLDGYPSSWDIDRNLC